jgi:hypothetical protein
MRDSPIVISHAGVAGRPVVGSYQSIMPISLTVGSCSRPAGDEEGGYFELAALSSSQDSIAETPLDSLNLLPYILIVVLMFECQSIFDRVR